MIGKTRRGAIPTLDEAETIAAGALAFLAEDGARLVQFMQATGVDPATLRARADSPDILESVLDYLLGDESALLTFASGHNIPPERIAPALEVLQRAPRGQPR